MLDFSGKVFQTVDIAHEYIIDALSRVRNVPKCFQFEIGSHIGLTYELQSCDDRPQNSEKKPIFNINNNILLLLASLVISFSAD